MIMGGRQSSQQTTPVETFISIKNTDHHLPSGGEHHHIPAAYSHSPDLRSARDLPAVTSHIKHEITTGQVDAMTECKSGNQSAVIEIPLERSSQFSACSSNEDLNLDEFTPNDGTLVDAEMLRSLLSDILIERGGRRSIRITRQAFSTSPSKQESCQSPKHESSDHAPRATIKSAGTARKMTSWCDKGRHPGAPRSFSDDMFIDFGNCSSLTEEVIERLLHSSSIASDITKIREYHKQHSKAQFNQLSDISPDTLQNAHSGDHPTSVLDNSVCRLAVLKDMCSGENASSSSAVTIYRKPARPTHGMSSTIDVRSISSPEQSLMQVFMKKKLAKKCKLIYASPSVEENLKKTTWASIADSDYEFFPKTVESHKLTSELLEEFDNVAQSVGLICYDQMLSPQTASSHTISDSTEDLEENSFRDPSSRYNPSLFDEEENTYKPKFNNKYCNELSSYSPSSEKYLSSIHQANNFYVPEAQHSTTACQVYDTLSGTPSYVFLKDQYVFDNSGKMNGSSLPLTNISNSHLAIISSVAHDYSRVNNLLQSSSCVVNDCNVMQHSIDDTTTTLLPSISFDSSQPATGANSPLNLCSNKSQITADSICNRRNVPCVVTDYINRDCVSPILSDQHLVQSNRTTTNAIDAQHFYYSRSEILPAGYSYRGDTAVQHRTCSDIDRDSRTLIIDRYDATPGNSCPVTLTVDTYCQYIAPAHCSVRLSSNGLSNGEAYSHSHLPLDLSIKHRSEEAGGDVRRVANYADNTTEQSTYSDCADEAASHPVLSDASVMRAVGANLARPVDMMTNIGVSVNDREMGKAADTVLTDRLMAFEHSPLSSSLCDHLQSDELTLDEVLVHPSEQLCDVDEPTLWSMSEDVECSDFLSSFPDSISPNTRSMSVGNLTIDLKTSHLNDDVKEDKVKHTGDIIESSKSPDQNSTPLSTPEIQGPTNSERVRRKSSGIPRPLRCSTFDSEINCLSNCALTPESHLNSISHVGSDSCCSLLSNGSVCDTVFLGDTTHDSRSNAGLSRIPKLVSSSPNYRHSPLRVSTIYRSSAKSHILLSPASTYDHVTSSPHPFPVLMVHAKSTSCLSRANDDYSQSFAMPHYKNVSRLSPSAPVISSDDDALSACTATLSDTTRSKAKLLAKRNEFRREVERKNQMQQQLRTHGRRGVMNSSMPSLTDNTPTSTSSGAYHGQVSNVGVHNMSRQRVAPKSQPVIGARHSGAANTGSRAIGAAITNNQPGSIKKSKTYGDLGRSVGGGSSVSVFNGNLLQFSNPKPALENAFVKLSSTEWDTVVSGLTDIVRLVRYHPTVVTADLKSVTAAVINHCRNLRSQVMRAAVQATAELFQHIGRALEPELAGLVDVLLQRTSDTNRFIKADSNHALDVMLEQVLPARAVFCITNTGLNHRNSQVRCTTARLLAQLVQKLGAHRSLAPGTVERLVMAASQLVRQGDLQTRQYAKMIFREWLGHPELDKILTKYLSASVYRDVQKVLDSIQNESRTSNPALTNIASKQGRLNQTM